MKYIDIHCHLDSQDYSADRAEVLERMKEENIGAITIGTSLSESKRAVEIAEQNKSVWACIGIHPNEKEEFTEEEFENLVKSPKVVGIGECGLDYLAPRSSSGAKSEVGFEIRQLQKELFEKQIEFALKYDKPLMLHVRDERLSRMAYQDVVDILNIYKKEFGEKLRGNIHFFAGDIEIAGKFLDLGFTMSFTGVVTFTRDYDEVIKYLPTSSIMSETDAPWVSPVPHRGKRNEPSFVIEVIKRLAEIRGEKLEELNKIIVRNAERVFGVA
jgi:TatD DNase family protein